MKIITDKGEEIAVDAEFMEKVLLTRLAKVRETLAVAPTSKFLLEQETQLESLLERL